MHQCYSSIRGRLKHIILIIHIIVFYDQNILLIYYEKDGSHVRLWHSSCVYFTVQRQNTAVLKCVHLWNNSVYIIILWLDQRTIIYFKIFSNIALVSYIPIYTNQLVNIKTRSQKLFFRQNISFKSTHLKI